MPSIPGLRAGTTAVEPRRFVKMESSRRVVQCSANPDLVIGISAEGSQAAPFGDNATAGAAIGAPIHVYGPGELCLLDIAGTITVATTPFLTPDSDGKGVAAATDGSDTIGAICLEDAVAGDQKPVFVHIIPASD